MKKKIFFELFPRRDVSTSLIRCGSFIIPEEDEYDEEELLKMDVCSNCMVRLSHLKHYEVKISTTSLILISFILRKEKFSQGKLLKEWFKLIYFYRVLGVSNKVSSNALKYI